MCHLEATLTVLNISRCWAIKKVFLTIESKRPFLVLNLIKIFILRQSSFRIEILLVCLTC